MNKIATSRADLIRCLLRDDQSDLAHVATLLGYYKTKKKREKQQKPVAVPQLITASSSSPTRSLKQEKTATQQGGMSYCRVVTHDYLEHGEEPPGEPPGWFEDAVPMSPDELASDPAGSPPRQLPLAPWSRLWPFLRNVLGEVRDTGRPDMEKIVSYLAIGKTLQRLPRKHRPGWAPTCQLVLDLSDEMRPFWEDLNQLQERLDRLRGIGGFSLLMMPDGPEGWCYDRRHEDAAPYRYRPPALGTPVLVLSDLGCQDQSAWRRAQWQRFGQRLRQIGVRPIALMPAPEECWHPELRRCYAPVCWDRNSPFPRHLTGRWPEVLPPPEESSPRSAGVVQLLRLLAPAIRIEPALLRAVRYLLPADQVDVGAEAAFWQRPEMVPTVTALTWASKERNGPWRQQYWLDSLEADQVALQQKVAEQVEAYHAHLSPLIFTEEAYNYSALRQGQALPEDLEERMQRLLKTLTHGNLGESFAMWGRRLWARQPALLEESVARVAFWLKLHEKKYEQGALTLPPGMEAVVRASWILAGGPERKTYQLALQGQGVTLAQARPGHLQKGSHLAELEAVKPLLLCQRRGREAALPQCLNLSQEDGQVLPLGQGERLILKTDCESLEIDHLVKPSWAERIGRDQYGLYADFRIKGVIQRVRWINPGRFLMGSPETEKGRADDERQHEVILTAGYWLADTPVTQALWKAVMGNNPSRFKGAERPVEEVSWQEAQRFMARASQENDELEICLPTEAQWEYGCRAGSRAPFSFGDNITPTQVNYNGDYPYGDGKKGEYREETVPVKSLLPNRWGLYQMHGNVWEWCEDWYGGDPVSTVTNPTGAPFGANHLLRGGSWFDIGRKIRSANRDGFGAVRRRYGSFGFRFSIGQGNR